MILIGFVFSVKMTIVMQNLIMIQIRIIIS